MPPLATRTTNTSQQQQFKVARIKELTFLPVVLGRGVDGQDVGIRKMEAAGVALEPELRDGVAVLLLRVAPTQSRDDKRPRTELAVEDPAVRRQLAVAKTCRRHLVLGQVVAVQALDGREVHLAGVAAGPDFRDDVKVVFVGVRHEAVVDLGSAKLAPDDGTLDG